MSRRRTCAIHQPNLFPRLTTLAKLYAADVWVVLDDVQFNARDYQQRAWLERPDGSHGEWLNLPVRRPGGRATRISEVRLLEPATSARRVSELTHQLYRGCRRWPMLRPIVDQTAQAILSTDRIVDVAELSTRLMLEHMGWRGRAIRSSSLPARAERSARLADLTTAVEATDYLCGMGGAKYLDKKPFIAQGLRVRYTRVPALLRDRKQTSGLWWLSAVSWEDLSGLLWRERAAA